jgi:hypothetical protein
MKSTLRRMFMNTEGDDFDKAEFEHDKISEFNKVGQIPSLFGLCAECRSFLYRRTTLENDEWACGNEATVFFRRVIPNKDDRIKFCTNFYPRNQMDLYEMYQIAHPIEIKKEIGFKLIGDEEDE